MDSPILVYCAECATPIAELQNGCLVIRSKHHGRTHVTVLPLGKLAAMASAKAEPVKIERAEGPDQ